jgi:hypothetical protein
MSSPVKTYRFLSIERHDSGIRLNVFASLRFPRTFAHFYSFARPNDTMTCKPVKSAGGDCQRAVRRPATLPSFPGRDLGKATDEYYMFSHCNW